MDEPLDESYFNWLCAKVRQSSAPSMHEALFRLMHSVEFIWVEPMDSNRAGDGKELREYFCNAMGFDVDRDWMQEPCSIFEFLIAFSERANFLTDRPTKDWFWEFMRNLHLEDFRRVSRHDEEVIHDILYNFVWRLYDYSGDGGMFPLRNPKRDQRRVEIWYQFSDYLEDQGLV